MKINKEIADQITELAGLFLSPDRIARIVEIDADIFKAEILNPDSEIFKAFYVGFDKADVEHRQSVINTAKQGSQPAQDQVRKYISNLKSKIDE